MLFVMQIELRVSHNLNVQTCLNTVRIVILRLIRLPWMAKQISSDLHGFSFALNVDDNAKSRTDSTIILDPNGIYMLERIDTRVLEFAVWFNVNIIKTTKLNLEQGKGGVVKSLSFSFYVFLPL